MIFGRSVNMELLAIVFILIAVLIVFYIFSGGNWKSRNFWMQQFNSTITQNQVIFDVALGVIMPVLCLILDPVVFRNLLSIGQTMLGSIRVFGYTSIALGIIALSLWLLLRNHLSWLNAFLAGILFYGAFFALLLGVLILPFSVIGLLALVGVLGFTPFFTSFAFLRNGVRAYRQATEHSEKNWPVGMSLILGVILIIVIPILVQTMNSIPS
jgi:hypothetical protein